MERVVNAAGKMTYLGASRLSDGVISAMGEAGRHAVDMAAFMDEVGEEIARVTGAEAGRPTASAAAGIVTAVAASITGADASLADRVPAPTGRPDEVVLQAGHAVDFGAPIEQLVCLAGATPRLAGSVNRVHEHQLAGALGERTAAILFVVSHHTSQEGMLPIETVVRLARERAVPVIVDAAAEDDPRRWLATGADVCVFSGHKAFGAPTSGFVCGRRALIEACRVQEAGIGRAMKVGRETLAGLLHALREWSARDVQAERARLEARVEELSAALAGLSLPVRMRTVRDRTRGIPRLALEAATPDAAARVRDALHGGRPRVFTRAHGLASGVIELDPRELDEADIPLIRDRLAGHG